MFNYWEQNQMMIYGILELNTPNSSRYIGILRLADCAIVTSGNYERYFIGEDNKRYWHILDGKTGKPADKHINSVTIVTKQGKIR